MSKLQVAFDGVGEEARERLLLHLKGGTPIEWISDWLGRAGHPISVTSLRTERRRLASEGK